MHYNTIPVISPLAFDDALSEIDHYAILLLDTEGNICTWNQGAQRLSNYLKEAALGQRMDTIFQWADSSPVTLTSLLSTARGSRSSAAEVWLSGKNGQPFYARVSITCDSPGVKEPENFIAVIDALSFFTDSNALTGHYTRIIDEVQDYAISLLDTSGYIKYTNLGVTKIKQYSQAELLNQHFRIFYPPAEKAEGLPERLLAEAASHKRVVHEGWRLRKDGSRFWGSVLITALHNSDNKITGFAKVTRDLTDRKMAEEANELYLKEVEKNAKDTEELAFIISHDLQEPLRTISSFFELLEDHCNEGRDETMKMYMDVIRQSTDRMQQLITGILEYSLLGTHREMQIVNMDGVLQDVMQDIGLLLKTTEGVIYADSLPQVFGHATDLRQLWQNLISNAIKFRKPGVTPEIRITVADSGKDWLFRVQDNGIGFDSKFADRIFLLFQRLHRSQEYPGLGIGLSYSKKIIAQHKGNIWAESAPAKGATIYFTLPQINHHAE